MTLALASLRALHPLDEAPTVCGRLDRLGRGDRCDVRQLSALTETVGRTGEWQEGRR